MKKGTHMSEESKKKCSIGMKLYHSYARKAIEEEKMVKRSEKL